MAYMIVADMDPYLLHLVCLVGNAPVGVVETPELEGSELLSES